METLQLLESWYKSKCNGEWEDRSGISIMTIDNPGWSVVIDIAGVDLTPQAFGHVSSNFLEDDDDWVQWEFNLQRQQFEGVGDPSKLEVILNAFLAGVTPESIANSEIRPASDEF